MSVYFWQLIVSAYLLGSVPAAYLAGKWSKGIDLRYRGSGNVGATNLLRFASRRIAGPVIFFDFMKGGVMVWLARWLGFSLGSQMGVGIAAVCGHNWPLSLRFKGGRGIITTSAVVFTAARVNELVSVGTTALIITGLNAVVWVNVLFKRGPLGVFIAIAAIPPLAWGLQAPLSFVQGCLGLFGVFVARRLTAPQPVKVESLTRRQVLINRLLFDRDIRDKETWLSLLLRWEAKLRGVTDDEACHPPLC
jgi:glycerol-3-phosphate acyltransferase PlsY